MARSRTTAYTIILMVPGVFLLSRLTWDYFHSAQSHTQIVASPDMAPQVLQTTPAIPGAQAQTQPQLSPEEAKARYLEVRIKNETEAKRLRAENIARLGKIIKETEQSFALTRQRRDVDAITFVKEASNRASLYLQCGDKGAAYSLYKEAVASIKNIAPATDTYEYEYPIWQFLLEYLKKCTSKSEEQSAIELLMRASDRPHAIPFFDGASRVANYLETTGRKQEALDFVLRTVRMQLNNKPSDIDSLTAWYYELDKLGLELNQTAPVEKLYREILAAAERYHAGDRTAIILPLANLSAFCIKTNKTEEGDVLAARALNMVKEEPSTCLLDKVTVIPDTYTAKNLLDKSDAFLRQAAEIKNYHFKTADPGSLTNAYRELKVKYEERNQWSRAESILELYRRAQEPGKNVEMGIFQDLFYGNMEQAAKFKNEGKSFESNICLGKADDAYLKVKNYFLKEPDQAATLSWMKTRQDRLRSLGLNDNLANQ